MEYDLRQLAVLILLAVLFGVRISAHRQAGGLLRDQEDGISLEGGRSIAIALRLLFLVGGIGGIVVWLIAPQVLPGNVALPTWVHWLAIGLIVYGLVLLVSVHLALGIHFSGTLHLRSDHQLVQSGPYKRVRHPMYTAFLMIFVGLSLLVANVLVGMIWMGAIAWLLGWRLKPEEAQLSERFGSHWEDYVSQTGKLLPKFRTVKTD
ncbi:MAG: isoprenylcysteine carboxylmethyltransferase family protein [Pseudomonadota bacterium]